MLIQAKYNGYCSKCGRPIFTKDVFDFNHDTQSNKRAICLVCFTGSMKNSTCPHWAVTQKVLKFTGSNRYKSSIDYWSESHFTCLICSKKISNLGKTQYIKYQNKYQHGRSYASFNAKSYIIHEPIKSNDNPDYHTMVIILEMLKMDKYDQYYGILLEHFECLLERNPCFKEFSLNISQHKRDPNLENQIRYIKTRCKIVNYDAFQAYIPYLEGLIELGIKFVKEDHYCDIKDEQSVEVSSLDFANRVVELEDINFFNDMYRNVVMPGLNGTGLEGLDLYGLAYECYHGDEIFAAQDFVWRLIIDSILKEISIFNTEKY